MTGSTARSTFTLKCSETFRFVDPFGWWGAATDPNTAAPSSWLWENSILSDDAGSAYETFGPTDTAGTLRGTRMRPDTSDTRGRSHYEATVAAGKEPVALRMQTGACGRCGCPGWVLYAAGPCACPAPGQIRYHRCQLYGLLHCGRRRANFNRCATLNQSEHEGNWRSLDLAGNVDYRELPGGTSVLVLLTDATSDAGQTARPRVLFDAARLVELSATGATNSSISLSWPGIRRKRRGLPCLPRQPAGMRR